MVQRYLKQLAFKMYLTYLMHLKSAMKVLCKATQEVFKLSRELKFPEFCVVILSYYSFHNTCLRILLTIPSTLFCTLTDSPTF